MMKTRRRIRTGHFSVADHGVSVEVLERRSLLAAVVQAVQIDQQAPEIVGEFGGVNLLKTVGTDTTRVFASDGTQSGTVELLEVTGTFLKSDVIGTLSGELILRNRGNDSLWITDGTASGTAQLASVSVIGSGTIYNGELYFSGDSGDGFELWKTNGTPAGTIQLKNINTGQAGPVGRVLFWDPVPDAVSYDVRIDDFTRCQTFAGNLECDQTVVQLEQGVNGTTLETTTAGALWYVRPNFADNTSGDFLEDTHTIAATSGVSSFPADFAVFNNELYFAAETRDVGRELWKTDGTAAGTQLVVDVVAGPAGSSPRDLITFDQQLLFGSQGNNDLYRTDGTANGTLRVFRGHGSGRGESDGTFPIAEVNGRLIVQQMGDDAGDVRRRLVALSSAADPSPVDLLVKGSAARDNSGGPFGSKTWMDGFFVLNDELFFRRVNSNSSSSSAVANAGRLWSTDGVTATTSPGAFGHLWNEVYGPRFGEIESIQDFGWVQNDEFYLPVFVTEFRDGAAEFTAMFRTDGRASDLERLAFHYNDGLNGGQFVSRFDQFVAVNGQTYYLHAQSQSGASSLWDLYRLNPSGDDFLLAADLDEGGIFNFDGQLMLSLPVNDGSALFRVVETQFHDPVVVTGGVGRQTTGTPTLSWADAGADVRRYELYINPLGARATASYRSTDLTTTSVTLPDVLADGDYEVWLRVHFEDGSRSRWGGAGQSLTVDTGQVPSTVPPEMISPGRTTSGARPKFEWTTISGAVRYELWVSTDTDVTPLIHETHLTSTSFVPSADLSPGRYRVWVRAHRQQSRTKWTATYRTEILHDVVQVTGGVGNQQSLSPTLTWNAASNATRYDLYINETGVAQAVYRRTTLTGTEHTLESPLEPGRNYQVWLRAFFADGSRSRWGTASALTVENGDFRNVSPQLSLNGIVGSWPAVDGAVEYYTWVNRFHENGRWFRDPSLSESTTDTSLTFNFGPGRFRVWLIAVDAGNTSSAWSNHVTFTIVADHQSPAPLTDVDQLPVLTVRQDAFTEQRDDRTDSSASTAGAARVPTVSVTSAPMPERWSKTVDRFMEFLAANGVDAVMHSREALPNADVRALPVSDWQI